jgi:hypothetical protein
MNIVEHMGALLHRRAESYHDEELPELIRDFVNVAQIYAATSSLSESDSSVNKINQRWLRRAERWPR